MEDKEKKFTDDELIEDVKADDDAPVKVIYRCKKCGQILSKDAKDCWKCSSKDIEEVVEEDEMLECQFQVKGTLAQIKAIKNFLNELGVEYK